MGTKKERVIYWTTTGIVATVMVVSALNFAFNATMREGFAHLGLPPWFRNELTVAKLLGGAALLLPRVPDGVRQFAYAGIAITIGSACKALPTSSAAC